MNVYDRLKQEFRIQLEIELVMYPTSTQDAIDDLKGNDYFTAVSYGTFSTLQNIAVMRFEYSAVDSSGFNDFLAESVL
jgi:hypothetical protein